MLKLGYKLMSEEHGPADLVRNAQRAERAGFDFAAISDHFFPWLEEQGHSPFAWSVLGSGGQCNPAHRTDDVGHLSDHALPSSDHRPGHGNAGAAERQPLHARARGRRALERT